jgi:hypothetical protein
MSRISGILLMITASSVRRVAQITCRASFFAPCGVITPDSLCPPSIENATGLSILLLTIYLRYTNITNIYVICYYCTENKK